MRLPFISIFVGILIAIGFFDARSAHAVTESESGAEWVASADDPGPDVPPVGRSLFDHLFTEYIDGVPKYRIPFPFETLTGEIEKYLKATTTRSLQKVLIPLGRSLQRNAASPHFFKSPRAVVAAEANPISVPGIPLIVLKDRFYLGYQPSASAIEVISYNESMGRFEFQIVEDYRADSVPNIFYADRAICIGCHQNHAPIFAVQPWDESNSNPNVSNFLRRESNSFYGIPSFTGIDIPGLIGLSADRANLLTTYQLLWQQGCSGESIADAIQCRADSLFAALRYRLAANTHAGTRRDQARASIARQFRISWRERWPTGIAVPSRELLDLDPFGGATNYLGSTNAKVALLEDMVPVDYIAVEDAFEPLFPRGPLEVWDLPRRIPVSAAMEPSWLNKFISGLGEFFVPQDVEILDQLLVGLEGTERIYEAPCRITVVPDAFVETRLSFQCSASSGEGTPLNAVVEIRIDQGVFQNGVVEKLRIDPYGPAGSLKSTEGEVSNTKNHWKLNFKVRANNDGASIGELGRHPRISARLPTGDLISQIGLEWTQSSEGIPIEGFIKTVTSTDIDFLKNAIQTLAVRSKTGESDALLDRAFRRSEVLAPLVEALGMKPVEWCCSENKKFPPIQIVGQ